MPAATGKRRRYKSLEVDRVDLVDRGANFDRATGDGSHILLMKRDGTPTEKQSMDCPSCEKPLPMGYGDRGMTMPNYCPECGAKLSLKASSTSKQEPTMPAAAEQIDVNKAIADALAKQAAETDAKIAKAVADAKAEAAKEAEALKKRAEDAEATAKAAKDAAQAEVEKREQGENVAIAKGYANLGFTDTDGPLFYRLSKAVVADDYKRLREIFDALTKQVETSKLFEAAGRAGERPLSNVAGTAEQQLYAKADELRKADPTLSQADAVTKATELYPDLRRAHQAEMAAKIKTRG